MLAWSYIETGQLWLMLECLGWEAVNSVVQHNNYTHITDDEDMYQLKGMIESYGRVPMMKILNDYATFMLEDHHDKEYIQC